MTRLHKALILALVTGMPAAALPFVFTAAPVPVEPVTTTVARQLCFTAGAVTYRVSAGTSAPDYRVKIDGGASDAAAGLDIGPAVGPDLRIQLVDDVDNADFALVDDFSGAQACASAGIIKTVQVVDDASPADVTLRLSREGTDADLKLFVHSARFADRDAAALFAAMRLYQTGRKLAQVR